MSLDALSGRRSVSPASSGRSSPVPRASRRVVEEELYRGDKSLRRYGALVERAIGSWETAPQEWADYIAFLGRLLKAIQSHPKDVPILPHTDAVASKLAQCLNPALPSGVHQKALEVYSYIFATFGLEYLSGHVNDYLPGLAPVLSFAALSVRPGVYQLYEDFLLKLPSHRLRPASKALILSLLPALEEETSEDFERAFSILEDLQRKYSGETSNADQSGYFWQCLFLCVITSPSRRQGALNYISRRLPDFSGGAGPQLPENLQTAELSDVAKAAISPEPGLLVRCFVAGLSDPQLLVQRGFLDVLVTHLPLHSPVLQCAVERHDVDRLVSAACYVLLRREMSLNRRLWTWFLGPESKEGVPGSNLSSPTSERASSGSNVSLQLRYFQSFGKSPLERCLLDMFSSGATNPAEKARPFRICLSLMDRWEIGGTIVSRVLVPALQNLFAYSRTAPAEDTAEVLRSASLFFDGIEANLIWAEWTDIVQGAFRAEDVNSEGLRFIDWLLATFNMNDEEMVTVYVPTTLMLLASLFDRINADGAENSFLVALDIVAKLIDLVPSKVFTSTERKSQPQERVENAGPIIQGVVSDFYQDVQQTSGRASLAFDGLYMRQFLSYQVARLAVRALEAGSTQQFPRAASLWLSFQSKSHWRDDQTAHLLLHSISVALSSAKIANQHMPLPTLSAIITLWPGFMPATGRPTSEMLQPMPALVEQLWHYLSPSVPKYQMEAARLLWGVEELLAPEDGIKAVLLALMRHTYGMPGDGNQTTTTMSVEAARRFTTFWNHSISPQSASGTSSLSRRASTLPNMPDARQVTQRLDVLVEPLYRLLDTLHQPSDPAAEVVGRWLATLASLDRVLALLFEHLEEQSAKSVELLPAHHTQQRSDEDKVRETVHVLTHFRNILSRGSNWTWECLSALVMRNGLMQEESGIVSLARTCLQLMASLQRSDMILPQHAVALLQDVVTSPVADEIRYLAVEEAALSQIMNCLRIEDEALQGPLLRLLTSAIKLRVSVPSEQPSGEITGRPSFSSHRSSVTATKNEAATSSAASVARPPTDLLPCLRMAFASRSARSNLEQWVTFLATILPTYAGAIFASLIPLVETICTELSKEYEALLHLTRIGAPSFALTPDTNISGLLEALELVLARAHEFLALIAVPDEPAKAQAQPSYFLGNMTSGVFRAEGPPSKTAPANSRLTVILAFQDSIQICVRIWTWSNRFTDVADYDKSSASTTAFWAHRLRTKTRYMLEQMFSVEPLESLEVLILHWRAATQAHDEAAAVGLLHAMQGSRPKHVLPAILDALCSRTSPSALPTSRISSQTVDLTASDLAAFLLVYLESTEDDAMDEIWTDAIAFLRDVLANPLPYRQILPALLSLIHLLARKVGNTNFGEQKKMRRDLSDIFQRSLAAAFTTMPSAPVADSGTTAPHLNGNGDAQSRLSKRPIPLAAILARCVADLDSIVDSPDRVTSAVNSICANMLAPMFHSKQFPMSFTRDHLELLLAIEKKAPTAKTWRKEVTESFMNTPRLFAFNSQLLEYYWLPVINQWALTDKECIVELLSRLTPPASAGIMFGVGANAARLEADRRTQLNVRRICLLLLASPPDAWVGHLRDFDEKLVELFGATTTSSPSAAVKPELFMLCRTLLLTLSPAHLSPLWPTINDSVQASLLSAVTNSQGQGFTNLGILQGCKLLDELLALSPDEFQLHEWLYVADTVDAVYQPAGWSSSALADQVAAALGSSSGSVDDSQTIGQLATLSQEAKHTRRLLLSDPLRNGTVDVEDIKAMGRDDFARAIVRPFLNQLSIHAYEGVYSMETPDISACRHSLIGDLLDLGTIVA